MLKINYRIDKFVDKLHNNIFHILPNGSIRYVAFGLSGASIRLIRRDHLNNIHKSVHGE